METETLTYDETYDFLQESKGSLRLILGIEHFTLVEGGLLPDMNGIADFSDIGDKKVLDSIASALQFLSGFKSEPDSRFAIVYQATR